ncbi:MAG: hypothetical protein ACRDFB_05690 [Rhabdochlamydiaceae bacterium]
MSVASVNPGSNKGQVFSTSPLVRWEKFAFEKVSLSGAAINHNVENQQLKGTCLSCTIQMEVGRWENRKIFIERVLEDIVAKCPKEERLVLISLGAAYLLIEYILGKVLIENGFNVSFLLVDPIYVFFEQEHRGRIQSVLKDFREKIEAVYHTKYKQTLPKDNIHYLSRAQHIDKYFPQGANVVVIESFLPYAEVIKEIDEWQAPKKNPEYLMAGGVGHIVPAAHANGVALVPASYVRRIKTFGGTLRYFLPLLILRQTSSNAPFYIDWGCKIRPDGTYYLSFSGEEFYLESLDISPDRKIVLETEETVQASELIPKLQESIKTMLDKQIATIKGDNSQKKLSQEEITTLLKKVEEVATLYMPGIKCFFSADYVLDRDEAMAFISSHAGHHYRKTFSLMADKKERYRITVDEIK